MDINNLRLISNYFKISNASIFSKWYKIACPSLIHEDNSKDSASIPQTNIATNPKNGKTFKATIHCFSGGDAVNYLELKKAREETDKTLYYRLLEKRSNVNNPVEFILKMGIKYNLDINLLNDFFNNIPLVLNVKGNTFKHYPTDLMGISKNDLFLLKTDMLNIINNYNPNKEPTIGKYIDKTGYLFSSKNISQQIDDFKKGNQNYLNSDDKKKLDQLKNKDLSDKEKYQEMNPMRRKIQEKIRNKQKQEFILKGRILKSIYSFYKSNGYISEYYKKRGISETVLRNSNVLEINKEDIPKLINELKNKFGEDDLKKYGILGKDYIFEEHSIILPLFNKPYIKGIQFRKDTENKTERFKDILNTNENFMEDNLRNYSKVILTEGFSDYYSVLTMIEKSNLRGIKVVGLRSSDGKLPNGVLKIIENKEVFTILDTDNAGKTAMNNIYNQIIQNMKPTYIDENNVEKQNIIKMKNISSVLLKELNDANELLNQELEGKDLNKGFKKKFFQILIENSSKNQKIIKKVVNEPNDEDIIKDKSFLELDKNYSTKYLSTNQGYLELNETQYIEYMLYKNFNLNVDNFSLKDIVIKKKEIPLEYKKIYDGHIILNNFFQRDYNYNKFLNILKEYPELNQLYSDIQEKDLDKLALEYQIIDDIHNQTSISNLDIYEYFVEFKQIIDYLQKNNIPFTMRGSASSSLILSKEIMEFQDANTFNPLNHQDMCDFKRFLNIGRKNSLPDIDIDIPSEYREKIRKDLGGIVPLTKAGLTHISRNYTGIEIYLKNKKFETQYFPIKDSVLAKNYPSFDILPVSSIGNMKSIEDLTTLNDLDPYTFLKHNEKYLHLKLSNKLIKKIHRIMKKNITSTKHFLHLISLNKTPFNLNDFAIIKEYSDRLSSKNIKWTNIDFLEETKGIIIYQEQLLKYLQLIGVDEDTQNQIRKLNTKPNKITDEEKKNIDKLAKIVENKVDEYQGEHKQEIIQIFEEQYINFKLNAYIFNYPHALSYHNINLNIYYQELIKGNEVFNRTKIPKELFERMQRMFVNEELYISRLYDFQRIFEKSNIKITKEEIDLLIGFSKKDYLTIKEHVESKLQIKNKIIENNNNNFIKEDIIKDIQPVIKEKKIEKEIINPEINNDDKKIITKDINNNSENFISEEEIIQNYDEDFFISTNDKDLSIGFEDNSFFESDNIFVDNNIKENIYEITTKKIDNHRFTSLISIDFEIIKKLLEKNILDDNSEGFNLIKTGIETNNINETLMLLKGNPNKTNNMKLLESVYKLLYNNEKDENLGKLISFIKNNDLLKFKIQVNKPLISSLKEFINSPVYLNEKQIEKFQLKLDQLRILPNPDNKQIIMINKLENSLRNKKIILPNLDDNINISDLLTKETEIKYKGNKLNIELKNDDIPLNIISNLIIDKTYENIKSKTNNLNQKEMI